MALYVDFAVEADDREVVSKIATRVGALPFEVGGHVVDLALTKIFQSDGLWYFFAEPGYINGWHPSLPFLNTPEGFNAVREEFYSRLRGATGFRRALFSHEAADFLSDPTSDHRACDVADLVVREDLVPNPGFLSRCENFSDGYVRVLPKPA